MNAQPAESMTAPYNPENAESLPAEFPAPWACDWGEDRCGLWMAFRYRRVRQCLRWIVPGEFLMGSPKSEVEREDDETQHRVILTQGYWLADTACTQALWQAVMGDNPSAFKGEEQPVENVSWDDAQRFIERLNGLVPGNGFRLPTEAEWEYACRAGTTTAFWFGDQIKQEQVNYEGGQTVAVKAFPCNDWGLYQMHGNVWEWCQDWFGEYPVVTMINPIGFDGVKRVLRGGGWFGLGRDARSASRIGDLGFRYPYFGFRLARNQAAQQDEPEASAGNGASRAGQTLGSGSSQTRRGR